MDNLKPYMFGWSILKGMAITFGHFTTTYVENMKRRFNMAQRGPAGRQGAGAKGSFTVEYPEERMVVPERFRVLPVLIYDEHNGDVRCTSCGICAKVCPPQCIWILQAKGEDGKNTQKPEDFFIETNVCMNCGLCVEFCPFDAIKMDHRFELASYQRKPKETLNLQDLLVSTEYYAKTHPVAWQAELDKKAKKAAPKPSAPTAIGSAPAATGATPPPSPPAAAA